MTTVQTRKGWKGSTSDGRNDFSCLLFTKYPRRNFFNRIIGILLPWPKKLRQAHTSNYRRVHAPEITRLCMCPLACGCPNNFGQGSSSCTNFQGVLHRKSSCSGSGKEYVRCHRLREKEFTQMYRLKKRLLINTLQTCDKTLLTAAKTGVNCELLNDSGALTCGSHTWGGAVNFLEKSYYFAKKESCS